MLSYGQRTRKDRFPSYFGFQFRPIFPSSFLGRDNVTYTEGDFSNQLSLRNGYSFGANVRAGFTKLLALETGISYTSRNFHVSYQYPDSAINSSADFKFINFDVPVNLLTYIQLSEKYFMNASLGVQARFNPSNAGVATRPSGKNVFRHTAFADYFNFDFNANVGFEYRTEEDGFFYAGVTGCVPITRVFEFYSTYAPLNSTNLTRAVGNYSAAYLALDLKYFFPYRKRASSGQPRGPIN